DEELFSHLPNNSTLVLSKNSKASVNGSRLSLEKGTLYFKSTDKFKLSFHESEIAVSKGDEFIYSFEKDYIVVLSGDLELTDKIVYPGYVLEWKVDNTYLTKSAIEE